MASAIVNVETQAGAPEAEAPSVVAVPGRARIAARNRLSAASRALLLNLAPDLQALVLKFLVGRDLAALGAASAQLRTIVGNALVGSQPPAELLREEWLFSVCDEAALSGLGTCCTCGDCAARATSLRPAFHEMRSSARQHLGSMGWSTERDWEEPLNLLWLWGLPCIVRAGYKHEADLRLRSAAALHAEYTEAGYAYMQSPAATVLEQAWRAQSAQLAALSVDGSPPAPRIHDSFTIRLGDLIESVHLERAARAVLELTFERHGGAEEYNGTPGAWEEPGVQCLARALADSTVQRGGASPANVAWVCDEVFRHFCHVIEDGDTTTEPEEAAVAVYWNVMR